MSSWRFVSSDVLYAVHDRQIAEHGGLDGIRDRGAVESSLARPQQLLAYGDEPDAAALAASSAFGFTRNHGFNDGNKRTAWILARVFLLDNGYELRFTPSEAVRTSEALAAGEVTESELATWYRERLALGQ